MGRSGRQGWVYRLAAGERGVVMLEFVLIAPILLLLLCAIFDFGDAFFIKQIVTNAAREGARYGVVYADPKHSATEIQNVVTNYLTAFGMTPTSAPTVTGAGGGTGAPLTVVVTVTKNWWVLDSILGPSADIQSGTVMNNE
jgi:Flp pilus assembly protein TadG